jgi:nondiscriminating aspartyl-tRNA synthetase
VTTVERILTTELHLHAGRRVRLAGWLHNMRQLSRVSFLVVRDRAGLAQVVVEPGTLDDLVPETVLEVEGVVVATAQAPGGAELHEPTVRVLAAPAGPPPVDLRRPRLRESLPTILDHAAIAWRHPRERAKLELAAASVAGFRAALGRLGFVEIQTPKIVASATEGGAEVFAVDYFSQPAYLAQSPQLYKQVMVGVLERVYETGPVFRAEPHETGRHLSEYVSLDAEVGFVGDHREVMSFAREAVAGMVAAVRERGVAADLAGAVVPEVPDEIPAIHFAETQELLGHEGELDLAPADERRLGEWARREHGSDFLFVVGFPLAKRPFYTHPDPERSGYSRGFDLLFRGLELLTGGQRVHRHDELLAALAARGLDPAPFEGYLEAFHHGMPPHGGFAIGLERWVAQLVGARNIRETALFPRDRTRLSP